LLNKNTKQKRLVFNLSHYFISKIRYDISRIKMKADDILANSETATDEAIALGIDISKTANYQDGQLTRFVSVEYKSDIRRDDSDYRSKTFSQYPRPLQNKQTTLL
jgi:hypothetical protein